MTDASPLLGLPYLQPAQAQKHVTHNEALRRLDLICQLGVVSATLAAPPAGTQDGDRFIVPAGAQVPWDAQAGRVACLDLGAWTYLTPRAGWLAFVEDTGAMLVHDGSGWVPLPASLPDTVEALGVSASPDATNRLAVASEASLFTHAGAGHQIKINKATAGDTASLLLQTNWGGRAEIGLTGTDDLSVKVSADGNTFAEALRVNRSTAKVSFPAGVDGLSDPAFGSGSFLTAGYVRARGVDLVTNGTGLLGNSYNYPADFTFDPVVSPNLPAAFRFAGYFQHAVEMTEYLPVDPNQVYRLTSYLRQESLAGSWSSYANGDRHKHYMGFMVYDADLNPISSQHHMRYRHGGTDSRTVLTAPLAPGDSVVHVASAAGWNETSTAADNRGLILFGYRNSLGYEYRNYSRIIAPGLFDLAGVNKATGTITLNQPLPTSMANPADPSGVWPVGASIANSSIGSTYKYAFYNGYTPTESGRWFRTLSWIGGIDTSGTNVNTNFPPGTAFVRVFWLPNYTNRAGGMSGYPDTGADHKVWFGGVSVRPESMAELVPETAASQIGAYSVRVHTANTSTGAVTLVNAALRTTAL